MKLWKIALFVLTVFVVSCSIQKKPRLQITHVLAVTQQGDTLTIKNVVNIDPSADIKIYLDGNDVTGSTTTTQSGPDLIVKLGSNITFSADETSGHTSNNVGITIVNPIPAAGLEYDYRYLGDTMSSPRIFRLPNNGAGDAQDEDDIYVAVMGGGYGGRDDKVGSAVFVINLEDNVTPGKLEKVIPIVDEPNLNIVNSVPGTPVVVTADQARGIKYKGALVYVNDFVKIRPVSNNITIINNQLFEWEIPVDDKSADAKLEVKIVNGNNNATIKVINTEIILIADTLGISQNILPDSVNLENSGISPVI